MDTYTALSITNPRTLQSIGDLRGLQTAWHRSLEIKVKAGSLSDASQRTYEIGADKFIDWCGQQSGLTDESVSEWIAQERAQGHKPAAVNTWLAGVRSLFGWAAAKHLIAFNPAEGVKGAQRKGTTHRHSREALTDREVMRVLDAPEQDTPEGKRDRAILALMAFTAARTIELNRANLADLKTESGKLVLQVQGKGRTEADEVLVITHPRAEAAVRDWLAERGDEPGPLFTSLSDRSHGKRLSLRAFRDLVKRHYKAVGVYGQNKTAHSLRHAAITNAVKRGAPIQKVRAMARHASLETTMIYYHEVDRIENPAEAFIAYEEQA